MKREDYHKVRRGSIVVLTNNQLEEGREAIVMYKEKNHVVVRSVDGKRFHGTRSLDCPLMVFNLHDVILKEETRA
jgi:hypothetical protein